MSDSKAASEVCSFGKLKFQFPNRSLGYAELLVAALKTRTWPLRWQTLTWQIRVYDAYDVIVR